MIYDVDKTLSMTTFLPEGAGFSSYTVLAVLFVSGLWFYAGYEQSRKKNAHTRSGFFWQAVGIWILFAYCIGAVVWRMWIGLVIAVVALAVEMSMIVRWRSGKPL